MVVSALGHTGLINLFRFVWYPEAIFTLKQFPEIWRVVTAFLITKPKFSIILDPYFLFQYGSGLERESARFSQPGDFFVYVMFVASVIVVGAFSSYASFHIHSSIVSIPGPYMVRKPSDYLPAQFNLAEAVPGTEGECPCISCSPVIRKTKKGLCGV